MYEIEVKARLSNPEQTIAALKAQGCSLSEPVTQDDKVFLRQGLDYAQSRGKEIFLRLRQQKDQTIFTLKRAKSNELDCVEKEVTVSDGEKMEQILELLGYALVMRIRKTRRKGLCDGYEVCLDEVDGLGSFIELEKMTDEPAAEVQTQMFSWLTSLGIAESDRVTQGYDTLLYNASTDVIHKGK